MSSYHYTLAADSGDDNEEAAVAHNSTASSSPGKTMQDLEGGGGAAAVADVVEPVPNLNVTNGNTDEEEDEAPATTSLFSSLFSTGKPPTQEDTESGNNNTPPSTRVAMLQFLYRQYVASQAQEHPQAVWALGKMLLVMVYFMNLMEQPLDYLTGTSSETAKKEQRKKRRLEQQQQQYNTTNSGRIRKGYIRTRLGVVHYRIAKPLPPQPTNTTTSRTPASRREGRTVVRSSKSTTLTSTTEIMLRGHREPVPRRPAAASVSQQQHQQQPSTAAEETTPIVCFHAAHRSSEEFTQVMPLFSTTNHRRFVLAIDILGYGQSDNPTADNKHYFSLDDLATCLLREVIDKLLVPVSRRSSGGGEKTYPPFIALGSTDLGCYLTTSILCRFPHRIQVGMFVNIHHPSSAAGVVAPKFNIATKNHKDGEDDARATTRRTTMDPVWSDFSCTDLRVFQSTIANRLLEQERKEVWHVKLQDVTTYDLGRDARRPISCPLLFVQWQQPPPRTERVAVSSSMTEIDDVPDRSGPEENNNNSNSSNNRKTTTSSSYNNRAIRLFTEGGGSNTPIGITDMYVVNDENTSGGNNVGGVGGGGGHPTSRSTDMDLLNEHAPEFIAVCEEFIQTMTT